MLHQTLQVTVQGRPECWSWGVHLCEAAAGARHARLRAPGGGRRRLRCCALRCAGAGRARPWRAARACSCIHKLSRSNLWRLVSKMRVSKMRVNFLFVMFNRPRRR